MARLIAARCPVCGAHVSLDPARDTVTCSYCGKSSFIERKDRPRHHPPGAPTIVLPPPGKAPLLAPLIVVAAVALTVCGSASVYLASSRSGAPRPTATTTSTATPAATAKEPAPRIAETHRLLFSGGSRPLVVVPFSIFAGEQRTFYGGFDAQSGALRWKTEPLSAPLYQLAGTLQQNSLILASDAGRVSAHSLEDGKQQWSASLRDRVERFCASSSAARLRVKTRDGQMAELELSSGRQSATSSKDCGELPSTSAVTRSLEPGRHPDSEAPAGIEAHACGGMRVMGTRNFVVPDQCRPRLRIGPGNIQGMAARAIWRHHGGWLLIGSRSAGTSVPMLGHFRDGTVRWTATVPSGNPLEASPGRPPHVVLDGSLVIASYRANPAKSRLTAFRIDNGQRQWDIDLSGELGDIKQLGASNGAVFALGKSRLVAVEAATGKQRFAVGRD
jgi:hypothetical protein